MLYRKAAMSSQQAPVPTLAGTTKHPQYNITGLKRWSCQHQELPPISRIKSLHIYDFDNTLFRSPLPNPKLWNSYTVSRLQNQDVFANGGWWHDEQVLKATGQGVKLEEPRAWAGRADRSQAELVRLSTQQRDALNILLTGRGERNFSGLITSMIASKKLSFDIVCLKPEVGPRNQRFSSTMQFKQAFLQDLLYTYHEAEAVKIYEDRPKHVKAFRDFLYSLNSITFPDTGRKPLESTVIQVADQVTSLDPVIETAEVQDMVNRHNAQLPLAARPLEIRRNVLYTAYLTTPTDTAKLLDLVKIPPNLAESEIKYLANSILIIPGAADGRTLAKVGGIGSKQTWQVTGFCYYQSSIWAVRVAPVPPSSQPFTIQGTPLIVLATYKNTKPDIARNIKNWQMVPGEKQYVLQTEVGEKVQLRIDFASDDNGSHSRQERRGMKRRYSPYNGPIRNGTGTGGPGLEKENNYDESGRFHQETSSNKGSGVGRGKGVTGQGMGASKGVVAPGKNSRSRKPVNHRSHGAQNDSSTTQRHLLPPEEHGNKVFNSLQSVGLASDTSAGLPYGK